MLEAAHSELQQEIIEETENKSKMVIKEPMGLLLAFGTYTYPVQSVMNVIVPALLCGNGVLIKHSVFVANISKVFPKLFAQANPEFPNIVSDCMISIKDAENVLFKSPYIGHVHFQGSLSSGNFAFLILGKHILE